jgi:hypothetical protein
MRLRHISATFLYPLLTFLFIPHLLLADNSAVEKRTPSLETLPVMPGVVVEAKRITPTTGTSIINREMIQKLPLAHGSVNEIIGVLPGVQYSEEYRDSLTAGEIQPPVTSVSGSRFYDNNYTLDGIGNNSPLDPASDALGDTNKLPGHPQIHYISPRLIKQITVYNSNIPSEFGGFTGGQIDVETIDPSYRFSGALNYRTTSDSWTHFHVHPENRDEFTAANNQNNQSSFRKHDFGLTLNTPLGKNTAIVYSYQQLFSEIPLHHLGATKSQYRRQENYFIKLEHFLADNSRILLTGIYSPTDSKYFIKDFRGSDYNLEKENTSFIIQWQKEADSGVFDLKLGYTAQDNERQTDSGNRYAWDPSTPSIDWEVGREGGLGALSTSNDELSLKLDYSVHPFSLKNSEHQIKFGTILGFFQRKYHRPNTNYYYYLPTLLEGAETCGENDPACIEGEQYLSRRTVYSATHSEVDTTEQAVYLQDVIAWKRFEFFPGVRLSYDYITENTNLAPRFSTSFDVFGNQKTLLFAGANRYYSGTLVTHELYDAIVTKNQQRSSAAGDWSESIIFLYKQEDVETPYTDEITFGAIQDFFQGKLKIQYIRKQGKREFARARISNPSPEPDVYVINNHGRSDHESVLISWQKAWQNQRLEINGTWQETSSSNSDYDTTLDEEDLTETIWYKDEELYPHEIPRKDFNRPVIVNLIYSCRLPYGLTFTNKTRFRSPYRRLWLARDENNALIKRPSVTHPEQGEVFVYKNVKTQSSITFDWHLDWRVPNYADQNLLLSLDVLNVFDKRSKIGYQSGPAYDYEIGRQFWAGLEFSF